LEFRYRILQGRRRVISLEDRGRASIQMVSPRRIVAVKNLAAQGLQPGDYILEVEVKDEVSRRSVSSRQRFRIMERPPG